MNGRGIRPALAQRSGERARGRAFSGRLFAALSQFGTSAFSPLVKPRAFRDEESPAAFFARSRRESLQTGDRKCVIFSPRNWARSMVPAAGANRPSPRSARSARAGAAAAVAGAAAARAAAAAAAVIAGAAAARFARSEFRSRRAGRPRRPRRLLVDSDAPGGLSPRRRNPRSSSSR